MKCKVVRINSVFKETQERLERILLGREVTIDEDGVIDMGDGEMFVTRREGDEVYASSIIGTVVFKKQ